VAAVACLLAPVACRVAAHTFSGFGGYRTAWLVRERAAAASGQFTETGLLEDAKKFALTKLAPALHRGRQEIAGAKREAQAKRAKLTLQPPNPTDLVGALRRQEVRSWLRSLPAQERRDYVAGHIDRLDPEVALAIVEAPAELSGVLGADRNVLVDRALQAQHGDALVEVLALERAVEIAEHAVETVRAEIARDVGVPDLHQWDQLAAPHEKRSTAPYLRKFVENGVEVIRTLKMNGASGGSWSTASPEEIAEGVYFASFAEYQQARKETQS
jgi:hypothetical protein